MENKENMIKSLQEGICRVTFTKSNGDERVMYCTLNENMIPGDVEINERSGFQDVYDVQLSAWRAFRWDSIKDFTREINA